MRAVSRIQIWDNFISKRRESFFRWVDSRASSNNKHYLTRNNLFIFPSKQGFTFLLIAIVLWILGTNYQNNLILALVFFMVALLVVAIHATFLNMAKIELEFLECKEAFVGGTFQCRFVVKANKAKWADAIELYWQGESSAHVELSIEPNLKSTEFNLACYAEKRGPMSLPRLCVQSVYPFGLVRCWTWLNLEVTNMVYPRPISGRLESNSVEDNEGDGLHPVKGSEDFSGLRDYVPGDNLRNVAWKALARGQGLFVKEFQQSSSKENWLNFDDVAASDIEQKLSILCYWVLQHYQQNENFGLRLPGTKIEPNAGYEHRKTCLNALGAFRVSQARRAP